MSMSDDKFAGLRCHGGFYTGVIIHCHWQWVSKGSVYLNIPGIGRVITIWDEVLWKLRVYFDGLVTSKKVFLESSHHIETYLDVIAEVIKVQSIVYFKLCIFEDFIESWWSDLMFQSPHATNFHIISTMQWCIPIVRWYHIGRVNKIWWILLGWWVFQSVNLIHDCHKNCFELFCEFRHFSSESCLLAFISFLLGSISACMMMRCLS